MQGPFIKSPILKIVLGTLSALLTIVFLMVVLFTEEVRMDAQTRSWDGRQIENGADLYKNNCASCHGPDGKGGAGPALHSHYFFTDRMADVGWDGSMRDFVALTVAAGRPSKENSQWGVRMVPWSEDYGGPLRNDQVAAVTAYVLNWERSALQQTAEMDPWIPFRDVSTPVEAQTIGDRPLEIAEAAPQTPGEPRDPEELFVAMTCNACHLLDVPQTQTQRGPLGPNFGNLAENAATRVPGQSAADYIYESIVDPNRYIVSGYGANVMPANFANRMSEEEIWAMVDWLLEIGQ